MKGVTLRSAPGRSNAMGVEATVEVHTPRGIVGVDASIAPIVQALNDAGVETIASCSGHGHRPANIALRDGREIIIARDFEEGRLIDRLFPVGANGECLGFNGVALRALRKAAGMKASDLAAALDISPEHISRMERGHKPISRMVELAVRRVCECPASVDRSGEAGETETGSTEGESAVPCEDTADAQRRSS